MKQFHKFFAASFALLLLTSKMNLSVSAWYAETENIPLSQLLVDLEEDTDGVFFEYDSGSYTYMDETQFLGIEIKRAEYRIQMESPEDVNTEELADGLSRCLSALYSPEYSPIVFDTQFDADGNEYGIHMTRSNQDYVLSIDPRLYTLNEADMLKYLQTIPDFLSVTIEETGYFLNDLPIAFGYSTYMGEAFYVKLKENEEITVGDFSKDLCVTELKRTSTYNDYLTVVVNIEALGGNPDIEIGLPQEKMYQMAKEIESMPQIEQVGFLSSSTSENVDKSPYLIDNGSIPFLTRGDCDRDDSVTIYDAYRALISSSLEALGESSHLTDREYTAADVNGDGKVSMNDAYDILMYSSGQYLGTDTSWVDILQ